MQITAHHATGPCSVSTTTKRIDLSLSLSLCPSARLKISLNDLSIGFVTLTGKKNLLPPFYSPVAHLALPTKEYHFFQRHLEQKRGSVCRYKQREESNEKTVNKIINMLTSFTPLNYYFNFVTSLLNSNFVDGNFSPDESDVWTREYLRSLATFTQGYSNFQSIRETARYESATFFLFFPFFFSQL